MDAAVASITWSVSELAAADVYPTLILVASHMLERLSHPDGRVMEAMAKARAVIRPLGSFEELDGKLDALARAVLRDATPTMST